MGWVARPPAPCEHLDRPEPRIGDAGRVWECDNCGVRSTVVVVDYGHDVMPGEASVEARWREAGRHARA